MIARLVTLAGAVLLCTASVVHAATGAELESRSKTFYDVLASGNKARAAELFPGLERDLEARQTQLEEQLDRMREQVVDSDGDVDALYQSSRWRDPEVESFVVDPIVSMRPARTWSHRLRRRASERRGGAHFAGAPSRTTSSAVRRR